MVLKIRPPVHDAKFEIQAPFKSLVPAGHPTHCPFKIMGASEGHDTHVPYIESKIVPFGQVSHFLVLKFQIEGKEQLKQAVPLVKGLSLGH